MIPLRKKPQVGSKMKELQDAEVLIKQLNNDLTHLVEDYGEEKKPLDPDELAIQNLKKEIEAHTKNIEQFDAQLDTTTQS